MTDEQKAFVDELVTRLVKKGQPLTHIYAEHEVEMPMSLRSLYNYIDAGELSIKNIDLRRKVGYKARKQKKPRGWALKEQRYREGRTYEDYEFYMKHTGLSALEMDTVKGVRERGKRLLTMIFQDNSVMLLFLMPDGTGASVKRAFDYLERGLGLERFQRLFPVILTDNGTEFKNVGALELTEDFQDRTKLFFCDPMASWQKGSIENVHLLLREICPKECDLKAIGVIDQYACNIISSNIDSYLKEKLNGKSSFQLLEFLSPATAKKFYEFGLQNISNPDEVILKPYVLKIR